MKIKQFVFIILIFVLGLMYQNCADVRVSGVTSLKTLEQQVSGKICYPYSAQETSKYNLKALYVVNMNALQTQNLLSSDHNMNGLTDKDESLPMGTPKDTVLVSPMDSDEDGLPDFVEILKGLNPFVVDLERDGMDYDGVLNRQEIQRGTDPLFADENEKYIKTSVKKLDESTSHNSGCGDSQPVYDFEILSIPLVKTQQFTDTRNSILYDLSHTENENIILVLVEMTPTDSSLESYFMVKILKVPITHNLKHTLIPSDFGALVDSQDDCPGCSVIGTTYRYKKVVTATYHTCALSTSAELFCWGSNTSGQLGDGTQQERLQPVKVSDLTGVVDFVLGDQHTCALTDIGEVYCWGANNFGQLGIGDANHIFSSPQKVSSLNGPAHRISASSRHTCTSLASGDVYCWGYNSKKALGSGFSGDFSLEPVLVRFQGSEQPILPLRALTSHENFNCLIDGQSTSAGGRLFCWGTTGSGCIKAEGTRAPFVFDNSSSSSCANSFPKTSTFLQNLENVQMSSNTFIVHREDKYLVAWTHEDYYRSDYSSSWTPDTPGDPRGMQTLLGQVEKISLGGGGNSQFYFIRYELVDPSGGADGVSVRNLKLIFEPTSYSSVVEPIDISSSGTTHACSIDIQGAIYCWGQNNFGQLGSQDKEPKSSPVLVQGQ